MNGTRAEGAYVLVVDDNALFLQNLVRWLEQRGFAARGTGGVGESRRAIERARPRAAVVDLMLPDGDGLALVSDLWERRVPSVLLSGCLDVRETRRAYETPGCVAVIEKTEAPDALVPPPRQCLRAQDAPLAPVAWKATARETRILHLLCEGLDPAQIAGALEIKVKTVANHITALLLKSCCPDRASLVAQALHHRWWSDARRKSAPPPDFSS